MDISTVTDEGVDDRGNIVNVWMFQQTQTRLSMIVGPLSMCGRLCETDKAIHGPVIPGKCFIDQVETGKCVDDPAVT